MDRNLREQVLVRREDMAIDLTRALIAEEFD